MRKFLLLIFFISFLTNLSYCQTKTIHVKKIDTEINIDGIIDQVWSVADSVDDFFQLTPNWGEPPQHRTVAKILMNEESIFAIMICYDDPDNIIKNFGLLDAQTTGGTSVMFDTFNDNQQAYKFHVSPSGQRGDCKLLDDARTRDYSWDGVWFSDTKIYDWGFVIEWEIPFKSIQYNETLTEWGLDFDRWKAGFNDLYWCEFEQSVGQRVSKFGRMVFDSPLPSSHGLNLEIYPVGIAKAEYLGDDKYKIDPNAGLDIFYNPSGQLTLQATVNPDFAQIEADPFRFNISRYETYYDERRPFFTEGNEIFAPSGYDRNSGFYAPLELFYPRRIGKKLPDGQEVPLLFGAKAFGRIQDWEYGGFVARTETTDYSNYGTNTTEPGALYASARLKKQIFGNSTLGVLFVGKHTQGMNYGVLDIDGAFRESTWQLAYQVARSFKGSEGDFAVSAGFSQFGENWNNFASIRYIGENFDVDQVGFVPWIGTTRLQVQSGPVWFPEGGDIRQILLQCGITLYNEKVDAFTDKYLSLDLSVNYRTNWGYGISFDLGKSKDNGKEFTSYNASANIYNFQSEWNGNAYAGYQKTYNFARDYLAFYSYVGGSIALRPINILEIGTSFSINIEGNPDGNIEDITYNARPYFSITPVNDLNIRMYADNLFIRSTKRMERVIFGFLFSYQFSPKSWIYFALNDIYDRSDRFDSLGNILPNELHLRDRAAVLKIKYLYYF
ncbi:MAG: hydrolase [Ignavibacteria bacterium RBG_13_36_8]|nr:MAG: hydrolase [Ignavibacteria bacterium RBG_13_36_8]